MTKKMTSLIAASTLLVSLNTFAANQDTGSSILPTPRTVQEASEWRPHVGLVAGFATPEGSGKSNGEYGLDIGYQPYIPFGAGLEYIHARIDDGTSAQDRDTVWLKASYHFGGDIPVVRDSYVGGGVAAVFKNDGTSIATAPIVGFDIPVKSATTKSNYFSLGANARYAIVSDGDIDTFALSGVVKYWY